jgi:hypothetical protein
MAPCPLDGEEGLGRPARVTHVLFLSLPLSLSLTHTHTQYTHKHHPLQALTSSLNEQMAGMSAECSAAASSSESTGLQVNSLAIKMRS